MKREIQIRGTSGNITIRFLLTGDDGAVQFTLLPGWGLPKEVKVEGMFPLPADLGYHSKEPHYDGQEKMECDILGECYYDGSSLNADPVFRILLERGADGVWERLEDYYASTFSKTNA